VTHLGALALGVFAFATHPYFEAIGASVTVLSGIAAIIGSAHIEGRARLRWRSLPLGFLMPSLVAFVTGGVGSGLMSGAMSLVLLYLLCYWLPVACALSLLVTRSSTPRVPGS
jgi:hypothetical protein